MGMSEISSIPLAVYDQAERSYEILSKEDSTPKPYVQRIRSLRDTSGRQLTRDQPTGPSHG